jgi:glycerol uptake facilitator-like aquaporin
MNYILRFVQVFTLGAWVGSIFYFTAVTPGLFRVLPSQDEAGLVVEFAIARLHTLGVIAGLFFLLASVVLAATASQRSKRLIAPAIGVTVMVILTIISQRAVVGRMANLRREMGSVIATPADNPLRVEFDRLHGISVDLEGAVLLIGFASLFLTAYAQA